MADLLRSSEEIAQAAREHYASKPAGYWLTPERAAWLAAALRPALADQPVRRTPTQQNPRPGPSGPGVERGATS